MSSRIKSHFCLEDTSKICFKKVYFLQFRLHFHTIFSNKTFPVYLNWLFAKHEYTYICCNSFKEFFPNEKGEYARHTYWRCDEMIKVANFLLENSFVRFGKEVYRQVVDL